MSGQLKICRWRYLAAIKYVKKIILLIFSVRWFGTEEYWESTLPLRLDNKSRDYKPTYLEIDQQLIESTLMSQDSYNNYNNSLNNKNNITISIRYQVKCQDMLQKLW